MQIFGYVASLLIGISLGLIGGGGSILTVPVMVYFFGLQPLQATSYSLFIVGSTSLFGAFDSMRKGLVDVKAALLFGASSIVTVFIMRRFILPAIPKQIITVGGVTIMESLLTMVLFAMLMILSALSMIRDQKMVAEHNECRHCTRPGKVALYGVAIGLVTGLLGAGGGFLLIPALVLFLKLPMKKAIGTSLIIIALNSLIGFVSDIGHFKTDWIFLLKVTTIAIIGIFIGIAVGRKIATAHLKKSFGWLSLAMGIYILIKETVLK